MSINTATKVVSFLFLLSIIKFHLVLTDNDNDCHFQDCKCSYQRASASVDVGCIKDDSSMPPPVDYFPTRNIKANYTNTISLLMFSSNNFRTVPAMAFANLTIANLIFHNNSLQTLNADTFKNVNLVSQLQFFDERAITEFQQGSLAPLSNFLVAINIEHCYLTDAVYAGISKELKNLKNLQRFTLTGNNLTKISSEQQQYLSSSLRTLDLSYNQIQDVDADAFKQLTNLQDLILDENSLTNLTSLLAILAKQIGSKLGSLYVSRNQIDELTTEYVPTPLNLNLLNLNRNKLKKITQSSLKGLKSSLSQLDLSYNQIESIEEASFTVSTFNLERLNLRNNLLSKLPSILNLKYLYDYSLANQNGKLVRIDDFAFERNSLSRVVQVDLDGNQINEFGTKAFCSRYIPTQSISSLILTFKSMKSLDKCHIKQLSRKNVGSQTQIVIKADGTDPADYGQICGNCDLVSFARYFEVILSGVCSNFTNPCSTTIGPFKDDCLNKPQFECQQTLSTTTTSSTIKTTTTKNISTTLNSSLLQNLFTILLCLIFLYQ